MAKPTEAQIIKYETEHIILLISLVLANNLWLSLPGKNGFDPKDRTTPGGIKKYKAWEKMGLEIAKKLFNWKVRQDKLQSVPNGNVQKINPEMYKWFLNPKMRKTLNDYVLKEYVKPGSAGSGLGAYEEIGFIPLLIWGVIALIAFFSAAYIIDETTTTTKEKEELLKTTATTLKELNIPPDKAAAIIQDTQEQASKNSGLLNSITGGGLGSLLPIALVVFFLMRSNSSKAAA